MSDALTNILLVVAGAVITILIGIIGYYIVRSHSKNDTTLSNLEKTMFSIDKAVSRKISRDTCQEIAIEESNKAVTEHMLTEHRGRRT